MKPIRIALFITLSIVGLTNTTPAFAANSYIVAATNSTPAVSTSPVSNRLIIKYKANNLVIGLSVSQINTQLRQPLTAQVISQLQVAAGTTLTELHPTSNGAHVLYMDGQPDQLSLNQAIANIANLPSVEYVEEDKILSAQVASVTPNDTYYLLASGLPGLWGLWPTTTVASPAAGGTGSYGADFGTAWNTSTGTDVVVAVVDTGITPNMDIVGPTATIAAGAGSNLISTGYDFITDCRMRNTCAATTTNANSTVVPSTDATDLGDFISSADSTTGGSLFNGLAVSNSTWHGTHVAGTIAALGNNSLGVIGGAYNAKILPVRVLGKAGGLTSDIAAGIEWAAGVHATINNPNPAKVINLSLGGTGACSNTMQTAINAAVGAGAVVVVAAGNNNTDVANFNPANCQNVISVAAIARDGSRATYSNYSSPGSNVINPINITLAAPGGDKSRYANTFDPGILSTFNQGTTSLIKNTSSYYLAYYQGTSMATPHVAAAAALMLAKNPALTPAQIKTVISAPASLTTFPSFSAGVVPAAYDCYSSTNCGTGALNAYMAVQNSGPTLLTGPASLSMSVPVGVAASAPQTITLTNNSSLSVQIASTSFTGTDAALFTTSSNTCTGTIAPAGTCDVPTTYTPLVAGAHTASLSVSLTGAAAPTLVSLTGSYGAPLTTANVTATTIDPYQSTTVDVSFTNTNAQSWLLGAVTLSQPAFMANTTDSCSNVTLAAGTNCTVTITISPTIEAAYTGTASLGLSGGGTMTSATISGTTTGAPTPVAAASGGGGGGGCVSPVISGIQLGSLLPMFSLLLIGIALTRRRQKWS